VTNAVSISTEVAAEMKKDCQYRSPMEACGFVVGPAGSGTGSRIVPMRNAHPTPRKNWKFDAQEQLDAYAEFDANGEDVAAVYHSHVNGPALLSEGRPDADVESAVDLGVAYIVVGLSEDKADVKAYRIRNPFVGVREATRVPLAITETGDPWQPPIPVLPWALSVGNKVKITYASTAPGVYQKFVTARVTGADEMSKGRARVVLLEPTVKAAVKSLALDKIRFVTVLEESAAAKELRALIVRAGRHIMSAVSVGEDLAQCDAYAAVMAAAFPQGFYVEREN
jgi:[CysO sulfur-carrier protein]-S-L-cysteine hydrolase